MRRRRGARQAGAGALSLNRHRDERIPHRERDAVVEGE
jgi:hypothetical protein